MKKSYNIEIDCALCASKCEEAVRKMEEVTSCVINFMTQKMIIEADDVDKIIKKVEKVCKKIEPDFEIEL